MNVASRIESAALAHGLGTADTVCFHDECGTTDGLFCEANDLWFKVTLRGDEVEFEEIDPRDYDADAWYESLSPTQRARFNVTGGL